MSCRLYPPHNALYIDTSPQMINSDISRTIAISASSRWTARLNLAFQCPRLTPCEYDHSNPHILKGLLVDLRDSTLRLLVLAFAHLSLLRTLIDIRSIIVDGRPNGRPNIVLGTTIARIRVQIPAFSIGMHRATLLGNERSAKRTSCGGLAVPVLANG